jgi:aspartate/methionine/tyrosine aminotransferase
MATTLSPTSPPPSSPKSTSVPSTYRLDWAALLKRVFGDGMKLFRRALDEKVIVVPGAFFDLNPGHHRSNRKSRFERHVRFSVGPQMSVLQSAVEHLGRIVTA